MSCVCSENKRPFKSDLSYMSNNRPRQWFVIKRNYRHTKSAGIFGSNWSDYSTVVCYVCGSSWKTKAKYVNKLENCSYFNTLNFPKMPVFEDQK